MQVLIIYFLWCKVVWTIVLQILNKKSLIGKSYWDSFSCIGKTSEGILRYSFMMPEKQISKLQYENKPESKDVNKFCK